jgi:type IV secretion system protein VirB6
MNACPAPSMDNPHIGPLLGSIDCHINSAVSASYGRLFGSAGAPLMTALTVMLTLYVAFIGLGLMTGRSGSLRVLTPRALALGLILTFATAWPAYQTVIYGALVGGPDEVARALSGTHGGAAVAFADRLDDAVARIAQSASPGGQNTPAAAPGTPAAGLPALPSAQDALLWASLLILLLGTVGVLVTGKIILGVLLCVGPVFLVLALFSHTRSLFEGWLKTTLAFALTPMLATLTGSAALLFLDPAIEAVGREPTGEAAPSGPAAVLFLGSFVYGVLMVLAGRAAMTIGGGWRLGRPAGTGPAAPFILSVPPGARSVPAPSSLQARTAASGAVIIDRDRGADNPILSGERLRTVILAPGSAGAASPSGLSAPVRLGQRFRAAPRPAADAAGIARAVLPARSGGRP